MLETEPIDKFNVAHHFQIFPEQICVKKYARMWHFYQFLFYFLFIRVRFLAFHLYK